MIQKTHRSGERVGLEQFEGEVEAVVEDPPLLVQSDGHRQRFAGRQPLLVLGGQRELVLAHVFLVRPAEHGQSGVHTTPAKPNGTLWEFTKMS